MPRQRARYVLPETNHPATHKCAVIHIPNDPNHIAAFNGAIYELCKPYNWQNDAGHNALEAAREWQVAFDGMVIEDTCDTTPPTWCASYNFHDVAHADNWSGIGVYGQPAPNYDADNHAWAAYIIAASAGASALFCMKLTVVDALTINYARICWRAAPLGQARSSVAFIIDHISSGGNDGAWAVATPEEAADFNGCATTGIHAKTATEHFFEIQFYPDGGSALPSGNIFLTDILIYGAGPTPPDAEIC